MANYRTYGAAILTSLGVAITGILWYQRENNQISAEDIAELYAAFNERVQVAYHTGVNELEWQTNIVPWYAKASVVHGDIMSGIRGMILSNMTTDIKIWWIAPPTGGTNTTEFEWPLDGDTLAQAETSWVAYRTKTNIIYGGHTTYCRPSAPSNAVTPWLTTSTRAVKRNRILPTITPTNYPLANLLYDHAKPIQDTMFPYGNWFVAVTTNSIWKAFKYGFEEWIVDTNEISISKIAGASSFSLSTNKLALSYFSEYPLAVTVYDSSTATNQRYAALYEATALDKNTIRFAVTDANSGAVTPNLLCPIELTVPEGGENVFTVRPRNPIPTHLSFVVNIESWGCNVSPNLIRFGRFGTPYDTPVSVTVTAHDDDCPCDYAGIVKLTYRSTDTWMTINITDSGGDGETTNALLQAGDTIYDVAKGGSVEVSFDADLNTNFTVTASYNLTINDLNETKAALINLYRTIAWVPFDEMACASGIEMSSFVVVVGTNIPYVAQSTSELLWGIARDRALANKTTEPSELNSKLFDINASLDFVRSYSTLNDEPYDDWGGIGMNLKTRKFSGCYLPYPSWYAVQKGYVSRVKIFAVAECKAPQKTLTANVSADQMIDPYVSYTFTALNNWVTANNNMTLGVLPHLAEKSCLVSGVVHTGAVDHVYWGEGAFTKVNSKYKMALIKDVTSPTISSLYFDVGIEFPTEVQWNNSYEQTQRGTTIIETVYGEGEGEYSVIDEIQEILTQQEISVLGFVVVVEWDWRHANTKHQFVPDTYTPEWIIANTNAP